MKKSLLFLGLLIGSMTATQAQCTIANSCTPSTSTGYCSTPAVGTALPNGTENVAYSTTIQVSLGTTAAGGAVTITDATVTAVTGLPTGLTGTPNPSNGVINGGGDGCILISGTPGAGTAGSYSVNAAVSVNTSFGVQNTNMIWPLTIDPAIGIATVANPGVFYVTPNPAGSQLSVTADFHFQSVRVFDALGNMALTHEASGAVAANLDLTKLNPGVYFIQVSDGNKTVTRKFIKQ